jgi:hypothetical protein
LSGPDVSNNPSLTQFYCNNNQLINLNVSDNNALTSLCCAYNQLTSLDVSLNTALKVLICNDNQLSNLNITNNNALEVLDISHNQFNILDVSACSDLTSLDCDSNQLTSLDLSKNEDLLLGIGQDQELSLSHMPNLCEVCVWELPFPPADKYVDTTGSPNIVFTTNCTATALNGYHDKSAVYIYPNPAVDIINIEIEDPGNTIVMIYNVNGILVYSKASHSKSEQIDVSGFPDGIYFVKAMQDKVVKVGKVFVR